MPTPTENYNKLARQIDNALDQENHSLMMVFYISGIAQLNKGEILPQIKSNLAKIKRYFINKCGMDDDMFEHFIATSGFGVAMELDGSYKYQDKRKIRSNNTSYSSKEKTSTPWRDLFLIIIGGLALLWVLGSFLGMEEEANTLAGWYTLIIVLTMVRAFWITAAKVFS